MMDPLANIDDLKSALLKRMVLFGALVGWCGALLVYRFIHSDSLWFGFLVWNLFLAAIPVMAAWLLIWAAHRRASWLVQALLFAIWLAFLPNAPYLLTDFVHLQERLPVPLWYDIALLGSFAGTGILLAYSSLADVQTVIARRFSAALGWTVAAIALLLSGFGIYLGRFLRWNSWDALTHPLRLLSDISERVIEPMSHPRAWGVTIIYGFALLLGYIALRVLQNLHAPDSRTRKT